MEELTSEEAFDAFVAASRERPVFLFKHSSACIVSSMAWKQVESYLQKTGDPAPVYLVKVIESRHISDMAAERLELKHASPQLMLVKDGKVVWHTSHYGVLRPRIARAAREAQA